MHISIDAMGTPGMEPGSILSVQPLSGIQIATNIRWSRAKRALKGQNAVKYVCVTARPAVFLRIFAP